MKLVPEKAPWQPLLLAALFLTLGLLIYGVSLGNGFVDFDDGALITENPIIQHPSSTSMRTAFTAYDPELYVPLTTLSYLLDRALYGMGPFGYHLTNLLLHTGNALLVVWFLTLLTGKRFVGGIAGLLFLVHPLHTEAVAWVSARKDLLSAFFALGSLIAYLRTGKHFPWLSLVLFTLALASKVSVVLLPLALLLLDWCRGRAFDRRALLEKIPSVALSALFIAIALGGKTGRMELTELPWEKFLLGCRSIIFSLQKLLWPEGLSVLYPETGAITLMRPDLSIAVLLVLGISVSTVILVRRTTVPLFAWGFFLLLFLPSLASLTHAHNAEIEFFLASDRYAYLPSVAFFLLVGIAAAALWQRHRTGCAALFIMFLTTFSVLAGRQALVWENTNTLFTNVLAREPDSHVAHTKLGEILMEKGDLQGALDDFQASVAIRPNGIAYYYIGLLMLRTGDRGEAKRAFTLAIAASPADTPSYVALAHLLAAEEKREEAIALLRTLFSQERRKREGGREAEALLQQLLEGQ